MRRPLDSVAGFLHEDLIKHHSPLRLNSEISMRTRVTRNLIQAFGFTLSFSCFFVAAAIQPLAASLELVPDPASQIQDDGQATGDSGDEGQNGSTNTNTADPAEYQRLHEQWLVLERELQTIAAEFSAAEPSRRTIPRARFDAKMREATDVLTRLRDEALAAYEATPNADEELVKLLIGFMINDASQSRAKTSLTGSFSVDEATGDELRADWKALELAELLMSNGCDLKHFEAAASAPRLSLDQREIMEEALIRAQQVNAERLPQVQFDIVDSGGQVKGSLVIELFEDDAPNTVANFINLVEQGYYNGHEFYRVLADFKAECGCPNGDGTGGPGYEIRDEIVPFESRRHFTGTISMANDGSPDSSGSRFILSLVRTSELDRTNTVFGRIVSGIELLGDLQLRNPDLAAQPNADRIDTATVIFKREHEYTFETITPGDDGDDSADDDSADDDSAGDDSDDGGSGADNTSNADGDSTQDDSTQNDSGTGTSDQQNDDSSSSSADGTDSNAGGDGSDNGSGDDN